MLILVITLLILLFLSTRPMGVLKKKSLKLRICLAQYWQDRRGPHRALDPHGKPLLPWPQPYPQQNTEGPKDFPFAEQTNYPPNGIPLNIGFMEGKA